MAFSSRKKSRKHKTPEQVLSENFDYFLDSIIDGQIEIKDVFVTLSTRTYIATECKELQPKDLLQKLLDLLNQVETREVEGNKIKDPQAVKNQITLVIHKEFPDEFKKFQDDHFQQILSENFDDFFKNIIDSQIGIEDIQDAVSKRIDIATNAIGFNETTLLEKLLTLLDQVEKAEKDNKKSKDLDVLQLVKQQIAFAILAHIHQNHTNDFMLSEDNNPYVVEKNLALAQIIDTKIKPCVFEYIQKNSLRFILAYLDECHTYREKMTVVAAVKLREKMPATNFNSLFQKGSAPTERMEVATKLSTQNPKLIRTSSMIIKRQTDTPKDDQETQNELKKSANIKLGRTASLGQLFGLKREPNADRKEKTRSPSPSNQP